MEQQTSGKPVEVSIDAVVIRADGTRHDLGTVSYWHRNPLKRAIYRIRQASWWKRLYSSEQQ